MCIRNSRSNPRFHVLYDVPYGVLQSTMVCNAINKHKHGDYVTFPAAGCFPKRRDRTVLSVLRLLFLMPAELEHSQKEEDPSQKWWRMSFRVEILCSHTQWLVPSLRSSLSRELFQIKYGMCFFMTMVSRGVKVRPHPPGQSLNATYLYRAPICTMETRQAPISSPGLQR
jgi:hypothetical protein